MAEQLWIPWHGHPDGASDVPWFQVTDDGLGYPTEHHPSGPSQSPHFGVVDGWAHPTNRAKRGHPTFQIVGSFAYAPTGRAWYRITQAAPKRMA